VIHVDWWYDGRRVPAATVDQLAARFPLTLIELLDNALAGDGDADDSEAEDEALALIDLSAGVFDDDE
jgi:phthiocerol/phenolphthiocerol synthesis type-I polyketide synthase E